MPVDTHSVMFKQFSISISDSLTSEIFGGIAIKCSTFIAEAISCFQLLTSMFKSPFSTWKSLPNKASFFSHL